MRRMVFSKFSYLIDLILDTTENTVGASPFTAGLSSRMARETVFMGRELLTYFFI